MATDSVNASASPTIQISPPAARGMRVRSMSRSRSTVWRMLRSTRSAPRVGCPAAVWPDLPTPVKLLANRVGCTADATLPEFRLWDARRKNRRDVLRIRGEQFGLRRLDLRCGRRLERRDIGILAVSGFGGRLIAEESGDIVEGVKGAEVFGLDDRGIGQALLQRRENLHPLDRIDAQVRIQRQRQSRLSTG